MNKLSILLAVALGITLAGTTLADSTDQTVQAVSPLAKEPSVQASVQGSERPSQELLEKLTPDQIFNLEMVDRTHTRGNDVGTPLIVAIVFGCPVAIVAVILFYRHRRNAMLHRTLAAMIEKGVPIPPELLQPSESPKPRSDLRRGLVLSAVGLGLILWFATKHSLDWGLGLIPLLIGAGYLVAWKLEQRKPNG